MANCFALLGDPWAGQRLLAELVGQFQAGTSEPRLEATVRVNHASVSLQIARLARQGDDAAGCDEALEHAMASIERTREIATLLQDRRIDAFADVHAAEMALLCGEHDSALTLLEGAVAHADAAGLWAHARQLRLLEAEALQSRGDSGSALALLQTVGDRLDDGHELGARIRYHSQLQRVLAARGDSVSALASAVPPIPAGPRAIALPARAAQARTPVPLPCRCGRQAAGGSVVRPCFSPGARP